MQLCHLFLSPGHNYFGHHEQPPGDHPIVEVGQLECVAGQGIRGDRFCGFRPEYKGQITFFEMETYDDLCRAFGVSNRHPGVFRRNVLCRGVALKDLIDTEFTVQGVRFLGVEECRPCHWMNLAFGPGAENALRGRGGLRARILSHGILHRDPCPSASAP
ncbi:MAG: molybdenum cofactor biosysynthesis protein [Verrucomicrobiae bacterium]|nr:molybdenum cofactor biosysynthesis protein [Verrucomicrobiae bacterium]